MLCKRLERIACGLYVRNLWPVCYDPYYGSNFDRDPKRSRGHPYVNIL